MQRRVVSLQHQVWTGCVLPKLDENDALLPGSSFRPLGSSCRLRYRAQAFFGEDLALAGVV